MHAVVRNLPGSGYVMGDLFTLIVGEDRVTYDNRQYYQGRGAKYNKNIRHGDVVKAMSENQLSKAYAPIANRARAHAKYLKDQALFARKCKKPDFVEGLARKAINVVGRRRFENYGLTEDQYLTSNYAEDGLGLSGFHAQPDEGYRGCGVYRIAIKDGSITATLYGGYHNSCPDGCDIGVWVEACSKVLSEYGSIAKADGSGCSFFLRELPVEPIPVKVYDVPSAYGGYHQNIEIMSKNSL